MHSVCKECVIESVLTRSSEEIRELVCVQGVH
jgi:hypothetical protein